MIPSKIDKKEVIKKARKKWGEPGVDQSTSQISVEQAGGDHQQNQTGNGTVLLDPKYLNAPSVAEPEHDAS